MAAKKAKRTFSHLDISREENCRKGATVSAKNRSLRAKRNKLMSQQPKKPRQQEYMRQIRLRAKEEGICTRCLVEPAPTGRVVCRICSDDVAAKNAKRKAIKEKEHAAKG